MIHDVLLEGAKDAIRRLFSDRSVPPDVTLEDLIELRDEINVMIEALESDMAGTQSADGEGA